MRQQLQSRMLEAVWKKELSARSLRFSFLDNSSKVQPERQGSSLRGPLESVWISRSCWFEVGLAETRAKNTSI